MLDAYAKCHSSEAVIEAQNKLILAEKMKKKEEVEMPPETDSEDSESESACEVDAFGNTVPKSGVKGPGE